MTFKVLVAELQSCTYVQLIMKEWDSETHVRVFSLNRGWYVDILFVVCKILKNIYNINKLSSKLFSTWLYIKNVKQHLQMGGRHPYVSIYEHVLIFIRNQKLYKQTTVKMSKNIWEIHIQCISHDHSVTS